MLVSLFWNFLIFKKKEKEFLFFNEANFLCFVLNNRRIVIYSDCYWVFAYISDCYCRKRFFCQAFRDSCFSAFYVKFEDFFIKSKKSFSNLFIKFEYDEEIINKHDMLKVRIKFYIVMIQIIYLDETCSADIFYLFINVIF